MNNVSMRFDELAAYLERLEGTSSRNELVRIVSDLYGACSVGEIEPITYLVQGRLAPFFAPVEIGLAERLLITAMAMAYGAPKEDVGSTYRQLGDLGVTAQRFAPALPDEHRSPLVIDVHRRLFEIAGTSGEGSLQKKLDLFA
ncbi:MAG TPA: DNA ligase, partial [Candidatus Dormibacteraeota bacterium]|nr:DNA ligase [Candidatus Dormibacteraeota bacterium]